MRTITLVVLSLSLLTGCAKHSATYEQSSATGTAEQSKTLHSEGLALWESAMMPPSSRRRSPI